LHIISRYLVFPDGRCFDLPSDAAPPLAPRAAAAEHARRKH
jgi:hypothetical protein